jgi:hypothetical protein
MLNNDDAGWMSPGIVIYSYDAVFSACGYLARGNAPLHRLCHANQGGKGKYRGNCRVLLLLMFLCKKNFPNVNEL